MSSKTVIQTFYKTSVNVYRATACFNLVFEAEVFSRVMRDDEQHLRHAHCQFELQKKEV